VVLAIHLLDGVQPVLRVNAGLYVRGATVTPGKSAFFPVCAKTKMVAPRLLKALNVFIKARISVQLLYARS
jgi:hypothetical protein